MKDTFESLGVDGFYDMNSIDDKFIEELQENLRKRILILGGDPQVFQLLIKDFSEKNYYLDSLDDLNDFRDLVNKRKYNVIFAPFIFLNKKADEFLKMI